MNQGQGHGVILFNTILQKWPFDHTKDVITFIAQANLRKCHYVVNGTTGEQLWLFGSFRMKWHFLTKVSCPLAP